MNPEPCSGLMVLCSWFPGSRAALAPRNDDEINSFTSFSARMTNPLSLPNDAERLTDDGTAIECFFREDAICRQNQRYRFLTAGSRPLQR
jgi:hypothetical protein